MDDGDEGTCGGTEVIDWVSARLGFDLLADAAYYAIAMYLYTFDLLADAAYYVLICYLIF